MLTHLKIQNYGLIEQIEINFNKGLSTVTGETGAGKSIILGAISLLLGEKADGESIKNKDDKCIVEGHFDITNLNLKQIIQSHDIDYGNELILRREYSLNGKSRAFINDSPVSINILKEIGDKVLDIHSQHENLLLKDRRFQLNILDLFSENSLLLQKYRNSFNSFLEIQKKINSLKSKAKSNLTELDFITFQFNQIQEANIQASELEELEAELDLLSHSEEIKQSLTGIIYNFEETEESVLLKVRESINSLSLITAFYKDADELKNRLNSVNIELKDIVQEINLKADSIEFNQLRFEKVKTRIDLYYSLLQKHQVKTVSELIEIFEKLKQRIHEIENYDSEIENLEIEFVKILNATKELASNISTIRKKNKSNLEKRISIVCKDLGMPDAILNIVIEDASELTIDGADNVYFLFSANKKIQPMAIEKIASGGEISRLMLILKSIIAEKSQLATIIFDEIDTGVSGEIADKMGDIMNSLSEKIQIICITHLPQIASKGRNHYLVYKSNSQTFIKLLNQDERLQEIAKLLSGKEITEAAVVNARELLKPSN
ncbi:MAG: DNA repair protein RecN [Bacteroidetes bacterium GWA2_31_9]|nr:MAG: DNA repair protein RecN [Bacteroidetes bacterium GWA2_31_9]